MAEKPPTSRASDQDEMPIKISGVIVNLFRVQASKVFVVCRALTIEFSALTRRDEKPLGPAVRLLILKKGPQIYMFAKKFSFEAHPE